jgi:hypothetical protein
VFTIAFILGNRAFHLALSLANTESATRELCKARVHSMA